MATDHKELETLTIKLKLTHVAKQQTFKETKHHMTCSTLHKNTP